MRVSITGGKDRKEANITIYKLELGRVGLVREGKPDYGVSRKPKQKLDLILYISECSSIFKIDSMEPYDLMEGELARVL